MKTFILNVTYIFFTLLFCSHTIYALDESDFIEITVDVLRISDGDTLEVRFPDTSVKRVRVIGLQAMEENDVATGIPDCNATNATARLSQIFNCSVSTNNCPLEPKAVLKVWDTNTFSRGRPFRHVFYDGVNIAKQLVKEGYGLAFSHPSEDIYNKTNWLLQQDAIVRKIGPLWDTNLSQCGTSIGNTIKMWVNWDAPGDDSLPQNRNGEWVKIQNNGGSVINIGNWTLRDSSLSHLYKFPAGSMIPAGATITAYVGFGSNTSTKFYMNQNSAMFENSIPEGAYLLNYWGGNTSLKGHIVSHFTYPCLSNCTDPGLGKIQLTANYDAVGDDNANPNGEWVDIKNTSNSTVDLQSYILHSDPVGSANYNFNTNSKLFAGETMRVYIGKGSSTRLKKYWGNSTSILTNSGDRVWLDTYDSIEIASFFWPVPKPDVPDGFGYLAAIYSLLLR